MSYDHNRNKGDKLRTIRRRMAYLDEKARTTRFGKAQRGEWLALRWAVLVIVDRYPHLRRPEDDRPVPHYMTPLVNDGR